MNYQVKIADINDPAIDLALRELIKAANNSPELLPKNFLAKNVASNASMASFFLIVEENNEIIGCNGFIANDFILNGNHYTGYQSCWSATHPQHQGKKIFIGIITEAKRILKEQGAGFLYGIANDRSNPIFTTRLGFIETKSLVLRIPNIPFYRYRRINKTVVPVYNNVCLINEEQVMEHKRKQYPSEVKQVRFNESWLWGKLVNKRKYGIKWPVFYVGGVSLASEKDLPGLLSAVFHSYPVLFVQFFSCASNSFNPLLKNWKPAKMNGFIFYNLNMPAIEHLNLMIGVLDIF